jgi:hypothetical protein
MGGGCIGHDLSYFCPRFLMCQKRVSKFHLVLATGVQVSLVSASGSHLSRPFAAIIHEIADVALAVRTRTPAPVIVTVQGIEALPR